MKESKLNVESLSQPELLLLFSILEGELEARDFVIDTLRAQRTDLHTQERYGRYSLSDPFLALQRDSETVGGQRETHPPAAPPSSPLVVLRLVVSHCRGMQEKMLAQLAAAESRHRMVIADLEEEKRRHAEDTAEGDDVTYILEKEKERLLQQLEFERSQARRLDKEQRRVKEQLEEERAQHKQLSCTLAKECKWASSRALEEGHRLSEMSLRLEKEEQACRALRQELEEERRRALRMEARVEEQLAEFDTEREQLRSRLRKEEAHGSLLKEQVEVLRKKVEPGGGERKEEAHGSLLKEQVEVLRKKVEPGGGERKEEAHGSLLKEQVEVLRKKVEPGGDTSGVCSSKDTSGVCSSKDTSGVCSTKDTSGVCSTKDTSGVCSTKDTSEVCSSKDTSGVCSTKDTSGVCSSKDTSGVCSTKDTSEVCSSKDTSGVCLSKDSRGICSSEDTSGVCLSKDTRGICSSKDTSGKRLPAENCGPPTKDDHQVPEEIAYTESGHETRTSPSTPLHTHLPQDSSSSSWSLPGPSPPSSSPAQPQRPPGSPNPAGYQSSYQAGIHQRFHAARHRFQGAGEPESPHSPLRELSPPPPAGPSSPESSPGRQLARSTVTQVLSRFTTAQQNAAAKLPQAANRSPFGTDYRSLAAPLSPVMGRASGVPPQGVRSPLVSRADRGHPPPIPPKKPGLAQSPPSPAPVHRSPGHFAELSASCGLPPPTQDAAVLELDVVVPST
ncbi:CTTNBP2 N-terminal-like protein [Aplochiton taeniatus]